MRWKLTMFSSLWLGTDKGCYVTQYDVTEFDGDCTVAQSHVITSPY